MKKWIIALGLLLLVFGGIYGIYVLNLQKKIKVMQATRPQDPAVHVSVARSLHWHPEANTTGQLLAEQGVSVRTRSQGTVVDLPFHSGQHVSAHALLAVLDHSDVRAAFENDRAQLALAQSNYERFERLAHKQMVSAQAVESQHAAWVQAQSKVTQAREALQHRLIRAPFACRLGLAKVHVGQLVDAGQPIVDCYDINALKVHYAIPQRYLPKLHIGLPVQVTVDAYPNRIFSGRLTAIDAKVSQNNRSVAVEVAVPNPEQALLPGMLVSVATPVGEDRAVVVVPQTAVHATLYGDSVFVLKDTKDGHHVAQRRVTLGPPVGASDLVVQAGLKVGDRVVDLGQSQMRDGIRVRVVNAVKPSVSSLKEP